MIKETALLPVRLASVKRAKCVGKHSPWIASQSLKFPGKNLRTWRGHRSGTRTLPNLGVYVLLLKPPSSNAKLSFWHPPPKATTCFSQHCPGWKFLEASSPEKLCFMALQTHQGLPTSSHSSRCSPTQKAPISPTLARGC